MLLLLAFVVWGFFRIYFGLFPVIQGITTVQHFHGALLLSWFALLNVQSFFIKYRRYRLHRVVGKVSYVLIPLLLLSKFLVTKAGFLRRAPMLPEAVNVGGLALNMPDILASAALYGLAVCYRKNVAYHMRYLIATALLMLGPRYGLGDYFLRSKINYKYY